MRAGGGERDAVRVDEGAELRAPLDHPLRRLAEGLGAARPDLDLGGDQLPDEVLLELRARGRRLEFLEPVGELERVGVEERELLLDGDGQVVGVLERLACECDLLLRREPLRVTHATIVFEAVSTIWSRRLASSNASQQRGARLVRARDARPAAT